MSSNEFWKCDPNLFWAYRFAYYKKIKEKERDIWLQGRYIYDAVSVALTNAFSKKTLSYPEAPYGQEKEYEKQQNNILKNKLLNRVKKVQQLMGDKNEQ